MEIIPKLIQALNDYGIEDKHLTPFLIFSLEIIRSFISNSQEKESKTKTVFEIGNFIRYEKSKKRKNKLDLVLFQKVIKLTLSDFYFIKYTTFLKHTTKLLKKNHLVKD